MSIEIQSTIAYLAPTRGRRYLTKKAAIHNEAKAIIYKHYPKEDYESDTGYGFDIEIDRQEYYERKYKSLCRALSNKI